MTVFSLVRTEDLVELRRHEGGLRVDAERDVVDGREHEAGAPGCLGAGIADVLGGLRSFVGIPVEDVRFVVGVPPRGEGERQHVEDRHQRLAEDGLVGALGIGLERVDVPDRRLGRADLKLACAVQNGLVPTVADEQPHFAGRQCPEPAAQQRIDAFLFVQAAG